MVTYITNKTGEKTAVSVPIELWEEIYKNSRMVLIAVSGSNDAVEYVFDERGAIIASIVPIQLWNDLFAKPQAQVELVWLDETQKRRERKRMRRSVAM